MMKKQNFYYLVAFSSIIVATLLYINNQRNNYPTPINTRLQNYVICEDEAEFKKWLKSINIKGVPSLIVVKNDRIEFIFDGPMNKRDFIIKNYGLNDIFHGYKVPQFVYKDYNNEVVKIKGTYILEIFKKDCNDCKEYEASQEYEELRNYEVYPHYRVLLNGNTNDLKVMKYKGV